MAAQPRRFFGVGARLNEVAGWVLLVLLGLGCVLVLRPFFSSLLWAIILVFSTWPLHQRLKALLGGHNLPASFLMTLALAAALIVPMALLVSALADTAEDAITQLRVTIDANGAGAMAEPPGWLAGLPLVGGFLADLWRGLITNTGDLLASALPYFTPLRDAAIRGGLGLGRGLVELAVSVLVAFFIYRDGAMAAELLHRSIGSVVGDRAKHLIAVAAGTIRSVVYGVIGTALIQAMLALFGFWILAVPQPFLLATCVFILGLFPVAGSSLVWIPVAIWQLMTGQIVAGIIMGAYGALVIGGVDNFLKPYLISRGSQMPFLLVFFGVIGGVMTFGILGIFLGPMLLALGLALSREWLQLQAASPTTNPTAPMRQIDEA
ncbi:MAG: AI-2E family transporter [Geminicoccaceae bacterium]